MRKHSISIRGHQTSYTLEDEFYHELKKFALNDGLTLSKLVTRIDQKRNPKTNLSSALRLFVLENLIK